MKPLPKTQQELLDAIKSGVRVSYIVPISRTYGDYFSRNDNYKRVTAAARALLEKGLVEKYDRHTSGFSIRIKK